MLVVRLNIGLKVHERVKVYLPLISYSELSRI